jgi:Uma2 family endonuclease
MDMHVAEPKARLWTRAEYHQMADLGWFDGQRAELVEGEIVVLSPQKFGHGATTDRVREVLDKLLRNEFWVRMQLPIAIGASSEPEPDVSVVPGKRSDYSDHPTGASLLIEVSDTTLTYDRVKKMRLYAKAGIAEYWIVNLQDQEIEVRRRPVGGSSPDELGKYLDLQVHPRGDQIDLGLKPGTQIAVDDLLG